MPEKTAALSAAGLPMVELFVGGIDYSVTQPELEMLLVNSVGPVNRVRLVVWPDGASKRYAFRLRIQRGRCPASDRKIERLSILQQKVARGYRQTEERKPELQATGSVQ